MTNTNDLPAGCVQQRRNRQTGTLIGIYRGGVQYETDGEAWSLICEDHGGVLDVSTLADARNWAAAPLDWCAYCQGDPETLATGLDPVRGG